LILHQVVTILSSPVTEFISTAVESTQILVLRQPTSQLWWRLTVFIRHCWI